MMTIKEMQEQAFDNSVKHGFWEDCRADGPEETVMDLDRAKVLRSIPEKVALIHSEASELLEAYREGDPQARVNEAYHGDGYVVIGLDRAIKVVGRGNKPKPAGIREELADILIRCGDLAGALGIDLDRAVREKMEYNVTRPHKHGKAC